MLTANRERFGADFLRDATGGSVIGTPAGNRVLTDSREDVAGALFVALAGPVFDGHDFVDKALEGGAGGAVVSETWYAEHSGGSRNLLVVPDPLQALQAMSGAHRRSMDLPVAAVTGSNGKTTTKDLLAACMTPLGRVHKTSGNRNNHIGLPLTLLELEQEHDAAVVEIGLNHPGELGMLAELALPRVGVITTVAPAHLEGLGSIEGVARAKAELAYALPPDGILVVPTDCPPLDAALDAYRGRRITFGLEPGADLHPRSVEDRGAEGIHVVLSGGETVDLPLPGRHSVRNLLAALAAARALGVRAEAAIPHVERFVPAPGRLRPLRAGEVIVLDDSYNANPQSLAAALDVLRGEVRGKRWAILGDMLELGPEGPALHRASGEGATFLDGLITVGELGREIGRGAVAAGLAASRWEEAESGTAAAAMLGPRLGSGDVVLVKGSRGARLETAVEGLVAALGGNR